MWSASISKDVSACHECLGGV